MHISSCIRGMTRRQEWGVQRIKWNCSPSGGRAMSYLVIGGTGFTGSHLVRALVERGYDVVTFSPSGNTARLKDVER
ncbi:MAG: NAD-dependent epimerase/dehydratase family protein, partial [Nitrososphaeria archaeon]